MRGFSLPGLVVLSALVPWLASGGNFYAGTSPANVPWTNGLVPYAFTNTLTAAQQQTYLDGLREWELAANVKFIPRTNQTRWILFAFNSNNFNNVSVGYNPQVVNISSLSRAQVGHEMGHSFGFTHENVRSDQTNFITVLSNNVSSGNLGSFQIDPTSVTNGTYDFESVMHLGWDFASTQPGVLAAQQPRPLYFPRYQFRMANYALSPGDRAALKFLYGAPAAPPTDGSGNAAFAFTNTAGNYSGQFFTATATATGGDTSEFGADVLATNKPAPAAAFSAPFTWRTNGFIFNLTFATNFSYRIQATTNLANPGAWLDLTNFTPGISSLTFTDRAVTNFRTRFYRVASP